MVVVIPDDFVPFVAASQATCVPGRCSLFFFIAQICFAILFVGLQKCTHLMRLLLLLYYWSVISDDANNVFVAKMRQRCR